MTRRWSWLGLWALLVSAATVTAGDTLTEFKWDAGKCKVLLPGKAQETIQKGTSADGTPVETHMLQVEGGGGRHVYLVAFTPNPALANASDDVKEKALDGGRDAAVSSTKGKLVAGTDKKIKLDNAHPGREFQVEVPILGIYRAQLYVVGDRLYQLVVAGPKDVALSDNADKFFKSFKLTGK